MPSDLLMPIAQFGLLALFVSAMVGSPGPANMALMANGISFGARPAVPFMLGQMSGFQVIYWLNVAGLFALLKSAPEVFEVLRLLCLGYILYLAWVIVRSPVRGGVKADRIPGYGRGFWVHPLNPKAYAMQIAGISQFVSAERYFADALVLSLTFFCLGGFLNGLWLLAGSWLRSNAGGTRLLNALRIALAGLMVGSTILSLQMIPA
ncbi:LysE family translocator [Stappia indica]|uniref:LysE family translocator n=1 Tax=Stappia indica TaxID=538381 RepID=UPI001D197EA0|nr:LysE family translocator [Stappia indica]MCC4245817.1 LysE family translocator [Stappia indica]